MGHFRWIAGGSGLPLEAEVRIFQPALKRPTTSDGDSATSVVGPQSITQPATFPFRAVDRLRDEFSDSLAHGGVLKQFIQARRGLLEEPGDLVIHARRRFLFFAAHGDLPIATQQLIVPDGQGLRNVPSSRPGA